TNERPRWHSDARELSDCRGWIAVRQDLAHTDDHIKGAGSKRQSFNTRTDGNLTLPYGRGEKIHRDFFENLRAGLIDACGRVQEPVGLGFARGKYGINYLSRTAATVGVPFILSNGCNIVSSAELVAFESRVQSSRDNFQLSGSCCLRASARS